MKAVILAAGYNRRLKDVIDIPKTLLKIGDSTILEKQINALKNAGVNHEDIFVVSGYKEKMIEKVHDNLIHNKKFIELDNAYSVYLALDALADKISDNENIIIFDGDSIYDDLLIKQIIGSNKKDIIVTKKIEYSDQLKDETMIVDENNMITKFIIPEKGVFLGGEWEKVPQLYTYVGVIGLSKKNVIKLRDALSTENMQKGWYTIPIVDIVNEGEFNSIEIPNDLKFCFDIDNPEDYEKLKKLNGVI